MSCSLLAAAAVRQDKVGLAGYPYDRRSLSAADITIAVAHPFSDPFGIPSPKKMDVSRVLVVTLAQAPDQPLDLAARLPQPAAGARPPLQPPECVRDDH